MSKPHLLIVEARFYDDMADALLEGAKFALDEAGATYDVITVPGALEIPAAIAMALDGGDNEGTEYDGFVALGMVIRGETYHFDIVSNRSSRALMDLAVSESLAIGNGILTVENDDQAWARVRRSDKDKGGFAARAALTMIELKKNWVAERMSDVENGGEPRQPSVKTRQPAWRCAPRGRAGTLSDGCRRHRRDGSRGGIRGTSSRSGSRWRYLSEGRSFWFRSIVSGVVRDQTKIDPLVRSALLEDWPLSRLDATVRAILRAGAFEILERKDVPVAVIVTEYVEIARAFFEHDEPKLVNAVLDRIAKQVRGEAKR